MNMIAQTVVPVALIVALFFGASGVSPDHSGEAKTMVGPTTKTQVIPPAIRTSKPIANHLIVRANTVKLPIFHTKDPKRSREIPSTRSYPQPKAQTDTIKETIKAEPTETSELELDSGTEPPKAWRLVLKIEGEGQAKPPPFGYSSTQWTHSNVLFVKNTAGVLVNESNALKAVGNAKYEAFNIAPVKEVKVCVGSWNENCFEQIFDRPYANARQLFSAKIVTVTESTAPPIFSKQDCAKPGFNIQCGDRGKMRWGFCADLACAKKGCDIGFGIGLAGMAAPAEEKSAGGERTPNKMQNAWFYVYDEAVTTVVQQKANSRECKVTEHHLFEEGSWVIIQQPDEDEKGEALVSEALQITKIKKKNVLVFESPLRGFAKGSTVIKAPMFQLEYKRDFDKERKNPTRSACPDGQSAVVSEAWCEDAAVELGNPIADEGPTSFTWKSDNPYQLADKQRKRGICSEVEGFMRFLEKTPSNGRLVCSTEAGTALVNPAKRGQKTVSVTKYHGFKKGDWVTIQSTDAIFHMEARQIDVVKPGTLVFAKELENIYIYSVGSKVSLVKHAYDKWGFKEVK